MVFTYLPHQSNNPYELLAISVLRQAYMDIYNYFRSGEPEEHEGKEAINWIRNGDGSLKIVIQAIELIQENHNMNLGTDEKSIKQSLCGRIAKFKEMAEGKLDKEADKIFNAWQLMSG